jgi:hypothetical protein
MALSIGFGNSVSLLPAIQATRLLTFASVGLSPTEHTCFSWSRFRTAGFPQYGWKVGLSGSAFPHVTQVKPAPGMPCASCKFASTLRALRCPRCVPHCVGTVDSVAHCHSRSRLLYPRGLRSGLGSIVPAHQRLIHLIRPTRRHIPISPPGGLYGMPSLCWCA